MTKNRSFIVANNVSLDSFQVFDTNESFFDFTLGKKEWMIELVLVCWWDEGQNSREERAFYIYNDITMLRIRDSLP
jgi:hypothetical protein